MASLLYLIDGDSLLYRAANARIFFVAGPEGFEPSTIPRTSHLIVLVLQVKSLSHELSAALPG